MPTTSLSGMYSKPKPTINGKVKFPETDLFWLFRAFFDIFRQQAQIFDGCSDKDHQDRSREARKSFQKSACDEECAGRQYAGAHQFDVQRALVFLHGISHIVVTAEFDQLALAAFFSDIFA